MFGKRKNKNVVDDKNTNNSQEKYTMKESYNADDLYLARFKWVLSEVTPFGAIKPKGAIVVNVTKVEKLV